MNTLINNTWKATDIYGCFVREIPSFNDNRGSIHKIIGNIGSNITLENNITWREVILTKSKKSTIRGLHVPKSSSQGWKISCSFEGEINDVTFDLRKDSPTYLKYQVISLVNNLKQVIIPPGVAHGVEFLENSSLLYATELLSFSSDEVYINPYSIEAWKTLKSNAILSDLDLNSDKYSDSMDMNWNIDHKIYEEIKGIINGKI